MGHRRKKVKGRESDVSMEVKEEPRRRLEDGKPIVSFETGLKILGLLTAGILVLVLVPAFACIINRRLRSR